MVSYLVYHFVGGHLGVWKDVGILPRRKDRAPPRIPLALQYQSENQRLRKAKTRDDSLILLKIPLSISLSSFKFFLTIASVFLHNPNLSDWVFILNTKHYTNVI